MKLTARMPSVVSSSASTIPERTSNGHQDPERSVLSDDRSEKPEKPSQPGYSQEDYGQSWFSQSGKVELRSTIDRGNLRKYLGMHCKKLTLIVRNLFSAETRIP